MIARGGGKGGVRGSAGGGRDRDYPPGKVNDQYCPQLTKRLFSPHSSSEISTFFSFHLISKLSGTVPQRLISHLDKNVIRYAQQEFSSHILRNKQNKQEKGFLSALP